MVLTLFMLLLLCLGSGLLLTASREFMESLEAMSWPTAVGRVTRSELKIETHKIRTRSENGIRRSATEDTFVPLIDSSGGDYYWIHQNNLDQPVKLVNNQDKPRDYSSAMRWIIANQILFNYDDILDGTFIDHSSTTPVAYQLRLNFPSQKQLETKQLEVWLEVEWSKFE